MSDVPAPRPELVEAARVAIAQAYIGQFDQATHVLAAVLPLLTPADVPHLFAKEPPRDTTVPKCYCSPGHPIPQCQGRPETWICHRVAEQVAADSERAR